ncbi:MAG TPA: hypothetical protein VMR44_10365 [Thermoanaerobaculia bacterium]|nr:hypothetical protein [Thermoanaerobaculia bacterium]
MSDDGFSFNTNNTNSEKTRAFAVGAALRIAHSAAGSSDPAGPHLARYLFDNLSAYADKIQGALKSDADE